MSELVLGNLVSYPDSYDPSILYHIPRSLSRNNFTNKVEFYGFDIWNCYELSWLNMLGKPQVAILELAVPCNTLNIIESKSLKLYLNSFNNYRIDSIDSLTNIIKTDLEKNIGGQIIVNVVDIKSYEKNSIINFSGICLDEIEINISNSSKIDNNLLKLESAIISEELYTNLFKSNCEITGQPDWASIFIQYNGYKINHKSLLEYLISFRNHNEFHEPCVERIFRDILSLGKFNKLLVYARFTRRGGIDINPLRTNYNIDLDLKLYNQRQIRQ